jgi:hypothetical protein
MKVNPDPDPGTPLNPDPIRIRIHNTADDKKNFFPCISTRQALQSTHNSDITSVNQSKTDIPTFQADEEGNYPFKTTGITSTKSVGEWTWTDLRTRTFC